MPAEPSEEVFPASGRLAGVDYGTVRIGIAVCDPLRILVSPLEIRAVGSPQADEEYFRDLARREAISGFVVGLPIHCDGGESEKSLQAREFARRLAQATGIPVRLFDERFTTSDAVARTRTGPRGRKSGASGNKRKDRRAVDAVAAQVLLESFLEAARYSGGLPGHPPDAPETGDRSLE